MNTTEKVIRKEVMCETVTVTHKIDILKGVAI